MPISATNPRLRTDRLHRPADRVDRNVVPNDDVSDAVGQDEAEPATGHLLVVRHRVHDGADVELHAANRHRDAPSSMPRSTASCEAAAIPSATDSPWEYS